MMKNDRSVSVDSCSSFTFPSDVSFCVPDFESAEHDSLNRYRVDLIIDKIQILFNTIQIIKLITIF